MGTGQAAIADTLGQNPPLVEAGAGVWSHNVSPTALQGNRSAGRIFHHFGSMP